ncbi:hypothetical protein QBC37DRAFT_451480 [Rhypophila decipiens]|uniref:HTH APSES-type domain-containing protein n=1 Tax=Rhypophila decipiens TaxID=261697 RepID=A0AAN6XXX2_9PEZI|nr:hypothetical protein QBC37DRAFT_451480 [Rhypophila decipiens]
MSGSNSESGLPSEPGALSAEPASPDSPKGSTSSHVASSRFRPRRAHSPPPTKPFPSSVYPTTSRASVNTSQRVSGISVSSYWSRSSRSSVNSGFSDSRYSTTSIESDRTTFSGAIRPITVPKGWRSPEDMLRQYNVMLAQAQRTPEANPRGVTARALRARLAALMVSLNDSDPLVVSHVTVNGNFSVCRRLDNDMINGTQLLYALAKGQGAVDAGNFALSLERQKHVVHSSNISKLQGISIPFERALGYANKLRAIEQLFPLFLQDLMPEAGPVDNGQMGEAPFMEKPHNGSAEKDAVMVKKELLSESDDDRMLQRDKPTESSDLSLKVMAELNLKASDLTKEHGKQPIPSIAHVLAGEDASEIEVPPASRPLSTSTSTTAQSASDASTSSNDDTIVPSTTELREILLTRLMDYFFSVFSSTPIRRVQNHTDGSSSANARPSSTKSLGQDSSDSTRANLNKRRRISGDGNGQDAEEDGPSKRKSKDGGSERLSLPIKRRLACPYFKNCPRKFQDERSCCGPGWWTVHRVNRRRTLPKEASEEEKWIAVYRVLFLAEDPASIPSPYYELQDDATSRPGDAEEDTAGQDSSELERYESFLRRELPVQVRRELEVRINESLSPLEESFRGQLVDIVRDVQLNLYESYKASRAENDVSQTNPEELTGSGMGVLQEPAETLDDGAGIDVSITGDASNMGGSEDGWPDHQIDNTMLLAGMELDDELAAYRPAEPYVEQSLGDFDGLLWDFSDPVPASSSGIADPMTTTQGEDSGYGGSSTGCSDMVGTGWAW